MLQTLATKPFLLPDEKHRLIRTWMNSLNEIDINSMNVDYNIIVQDHTNKIMHQIVSKTFIFKIY